MRRLIRKGKVTVNGDVVKDPGYAVNPEMDEVRVEGAPVVYEEKLYIMLNKPKGYVSTTRGDLSVLDLLPPRLWRRKLFPAGRLDKDAEGLLIITNDGLFAQRFLHPRRRIPRTYEVELDRPISSEDLSRVRGGVTLRSGERIERVEIEPLGGRRAKVRVWEGRYQIVKRVMAALGYRVRSLRRVAIGELSLDPSLAPGEWRFLTEEEREKVQSPCPPKT